MMLIQKEFILEVMELDHLNLISNVLRTPRIFDFCTLIVHKIVLSKSTIPTGSISDKKS